MKKWIAPFPNLKKQMKNKKTDLQTVCQEAASIVEGALKEEQSSLSVKEIGQVTFVDKGISLLRGLAHAELDELVQFSKDTLGIIFNLDPDEVGIVLLNREEGIQGGSEVQKTGRIVSVPVGDQMLGRVIDPLGRPLDGKGEIEIKDRWPIERPAPSIMDRAPVTEPLRTGIQIIDAMIPIGRGQRELILGDRQTGKTTIAIDTILNQKDQNVICIYCAIGQRTSQVRKTIDVLNENQAMQYSIVMMATGEDTPGLNFIAPYAATSIGEYFRDQGKDVLVIYDDLTHHARSYREVSLLLRRPPTREAFPGDIFYIHSRLLERATHLKKELSGGSLTALPIIETQAQNISAYIPTNLISITDGQIYLSPSLYQEGILPAIDIGKSVSRVGGKTQLPAYSAFVGKLRLIYSQFEEMEMFSRFSSRLDETTQKMLQRGYRIREMFKQKEHDPITMCDQIAISFALINGVMDAFPIDQTADCKSKIEQNFFRLGSSICQKIEQGHRLSVDDQKELITIVQQILGGSM